MGVIARAITSVESLGTSAWSSHGPGWQFLMPGRSHRRTVAGKLQKGSRVDPAWSQLTSFVQGMDPGLHLSVCPPACSSESVQSSGWAKGYVCTRSFQLRHQQDVRQASSSVGSGEG